MILYTPLNRSKYVPTSKTLKNKSIVKFIPLIFFLLLSVCINHAQQKNFSYFKLCVTNERDEILLVKFQDIWELPGKKYIDSRSISEFTSFMSEELGVTHDELRLRGLFTFYYNKAQYPIIYNYYSSKYKSGDLTVPPGCSDIAWFSIEEAQSIIPIKSMRLILGKMFEQKSYVWGASILIHKGTSLDGEIEFKEDFYPLSK